MVDKEVRISVLERAQELLSIRKHWLQGELCTDENGVACSITSADAVCFDILGAIRRACCELGHIDTDRIDPEKSSCPFSDNPVYASVLEDCCGNRLSLSNHISRLEEGLGSFNDEEETLYWDIMALVAHTIRNLQKDETEEEEEDSS